MYKIMIVDDEPLTIKAISFIISKHFPEIKICESTGDGLLSIELARKNKPDIIFMDIKLKGLNGLDAIKEIRKFLTQTVIIIISAYDDFTFAQKGIQLGVEDYILKPISKDDIINLIFRAINYLDHLKKETREKLLLKERLTRSKKLSSYPFQPPWNLEKKLFKAIEREKSNDVLLALNDLFTSLTDDISLTEIKNYFQEIMAVIFRLFYEYIPKEQFEKINVKIIQEKIDTTTSKEELFSRIEGILFTINKMIIPYRINTTNPLLLKARNFIDKNYSSEINLDVIAKEVAISPNYLSKLFKENFHISLIDYLTRIRIKKAIQLLNNTDLTIKEIAQKIGYHDSNYFSKVFKKLTKKTPTEFRR